MLEAGDGALLSSIHERRCVLVRHPLLCAWQSAVRLSELTRRTVSQPQKTFRVLMLSMTGTVLCGPLEILPSDFSGLPFQTECGKSLQRDRQERSEL